MVTSKGIGSRQGGPQDSFSLVFGLVILLTLSNPVTQAPTFYSLNADIAAAAAAATEDREGRELDSAAEITDIKNIGGKNRGQNRG